MSELKLNLIDSQKILRGKIHGSVADRTVAALTAEPETVDELKVAVARYEKSAIDLDLFSSFSESHEIDQLSWDAGLMIIDLPARLVMTISTYSHPSAEGEVDYHDGNCATEIVIPYRVSADWKFVYSLEEYIYLRDERIADRAASPPLDTRRILYGAPLLEFVAKETASRFEMVETTRAETNTTHETFSPFQSADNWPTEIHSKWLSSPRADLGNRSPREVLLHKQDYIDFDMHTRELQWSFLHEGPPCLPLDSNAYRFAGFGTHEWVIYYDLVRLLICAAFSLVDPKSARNETTESQLLVTTPVVSDASVSIRAQLEQIMTAWLETPNHDYDNRTPANLIESERKRLPIAMTPRDMVVSDDCPICRMMANDMELAHEVGFWHLDGSQMDEGFVFSSFLTLAEWEADRLRWEEFNENFAREQAERKAREKERFLTADASG